MNLPHYPEGTQDKKTHRLLYGKGAACGNNNGSPGYSNNTRAKMGKDADRHTYRQPWRGKVMKCAACFDYNKGVVRGPCDRCGHERLSGVDPGSQFAKLVNGQTWDEDTNYHNGLNTGYVYELVKTLFGPQATVSRQGSARKHTDTFFSDLDLMVHLVPTQPTWNPKGLLDKKKMIKEQKNELMGALSNHPAFKIVTPGLHAIKVVPYRGSNIDIVPHHNKFATINSKTYLRPATDEFFEKPSAQTAVRALKLWANIQLNRRVVGVLCEELVLLHVSLTQTGGNSTLLQNTEDRGTEGLHIFQHAIRLLTDPTELVQHINRTQYPAAFAYKESKGAEFSHLLKKVAKVAETWLTKWEEESHENLREAFNRSFTLKPQADERNVDDLVASFSRSVSLGNRAGSA
eukprot:gb/GEZN01007076.1/.p1 GENE.gb/GEZN01007076.1/~~gb/GEZN01007076.1/.p1  ORF type:complete len:403 (+),score=25.68 gb/GEZN01007076.1/:31-1239(+)